VSARLCRHSKYRRHGLHAISRSFMMPGFKMRNDGLYTLYSLVDSQDNDFHGHLLEAVIQEMRQTATGQQDRERLNRARRTGPGMSGKQCSAVRSKTWTS